MKKTHKYTNLYMPLGMLYGIVFGMLTYGIALDSIGIGISLGICIGMCLGVGIGSAKDAKINKQLEEYGYTVRSISETPDGYDVIISDKHGGEKAVPVSRKALVHEKFKPGDLVYLSGSRIEQAYPAGGK